MNGRFLVRRAQETKRRRALFDAGAFTETTGVWFQNYFMYSFQNRGRWEYRASFSINTFPTPEKNIETMPCWGKK